jgi:methionyl-tRNA formyltransferase
MRIGWIGAHIEGIPALRALLERGVSIVAVVTLRPEAAARRSAAALGEYRKLCRQFSVALHEVESINDGASIQLLHGLDLDLLFVIGWNQILRPEVLRLASIGVIGAHASLLPSDRGRAPINWALIRGATRTGNTLFWLTAGVDAGDIIDQVPIPITPYDTCASLYRQVAITNRDMILRVLPALLAGLRPGRSQGEPMSAPLPARRPQDGLVEWAQASAAVYNFVRALSRPYPGAFTFNGHDRFTIWRCALLPALLQPRGRTLSGEVIGPLVSPDARACGQIVACGEGAVVLLEMQHQSGALIRGRALSELHWTGQVLGRRVEVSIT